MAAPRQAETLPQGVPSTNPSYLQWGPVWAGAIMAIAISIILMQFGAAVGLASSEPFRADNSVSYNFIVVGLWLLLISASSSAAAGYLSGRMRITMNDASEDEIEFRDGVHGLTAWAVASFVMAIIGVATATLATMALAITEGAELSAELQSWANNQSVIIGFATAAGSALGAAAAWFASVVGGKHRDEGTSHDVVVPSIFRKT